MSNFMRALSQISFVSLGALLVAGAALAGEEHCRVPMADWQPRAAVQSLVEGQGLTVRRIKIDDGCYEVHARDAEGREVELKLDPATLDVIDSKLEGERTHRHNH